MYKKRTSDVPNGQIIPIALIGELLISTRHERGLSQHQLAQRLSKHQQVIARWEIDKYHDVTFANVLKVAQALDIDIHVILSPPESG